LILIYFHILIGPIPLEFTRLAHLEKLNLADEPLTGFIERRIASFSSFLFEKLGEFPLVEGSFRNLIEIVLPNGISSFGR